MYEESDKSCDVEQTKNKLLLETWSCRFYESLIPKSAKGIITENLTVTVYFGSEYLEIA